MTSVVCELLYNQSINQEYFILHFKWDYSAPKAGQFFMMKPLRSNVFLQRPISVFEFNQQEKILKFLISKRGKGTIELSQLPQGEKLLLTGPAGNSWSEFLPDNGGSAALVGGSVGIAPMSCLISEKPDYEFHLFAGLKKGFCNKEEENAFLGQGVNAKKVIITCEDGVNGLSGRVTDFLFEIEKYKVVFGCGPISMLSALKKRLEPKKTACFISLESRFACGVGACLGCTINTVNGNRCCCKHGPIFPAKDILFNE